MNIVTVGLLQIILHLIGLAITTHTMIVISKQSNPYHGGPEESNEYIFITSFVNVASSRLAAAAIAQAEDNNENENKLA